METKIPIAACLVVAWLSIATFGMPSPVSAEWYVAGDVGVNFADRLTDISGTGDLTGQHPRDFDLKNSVSYGAKLGYFREHSWFGIEGEVLQTTPHIKNLDAEPGIHLRVTTIGVNLLARYPGRTFQPYAGVGVGTVIAHLSDSAKTQSDTDVASGWNMLAGLRAFVTPMLPSLPNTNIQGPRYGSIRRLALEALKVSTEHSMCWSASPIISSRMLKKSLFSPARPRRLLHPPALNLSRQPLCPGTRLFPCGVLAALRGSTSRRNFGRRKLEKGFSVRQDLLHGRTAHTKCGMYLLASSLAAALLGTRRVSARRGWAGEKSGLFEHPARGSPVVLDARTIKFPLCHNSSSAAC